MDFIAVYGIDLADKVDRLKGMATSALYDYVYAYTSSQVQCLFIGRQAALPNTGATLKFFDGHASWDGSFCHSQFLSQNAEKLIEKALSVDGDLANGVFCAGKVTNSGNSIRVEVVTDWAGQYPVYIWKNKSQAIVSNNVTMIECLTKASRNVAQAAMNLVSIGGAWRNTHLDGVTRLDVGEAVTISPEDGFLIRRRSDHGGTGIAYEEAIHMALREVNSHLAAVIRATPGAVYISDLTGGRDTRCIISLIQQAPSFEYRVRCMGVFPSPDANVAGYLMEKLNLRGCKYPSVQVPAEFAVRQNAVLSGGAREAGNFVSPVAFPELVHFKGTFGELGGGNAGIDYISETLNAGAFSLDKALDLLMARQKTVGMLRFVTDDAICYAREEEKKLFIKLEESGVKRDNLFAERYLRVKCRSHFGIASFISNKNHISPDLLANRWIVEARRSLPQALYRKNKVIFDLIARSSCERLQFLPMAGSKWDEAVIPAEHKGAWAAMRVVDLSSANLSEKVGPLFERISVPCESMRGFSSLGLRTHAGAGRAIIPQLEQWEINKAFVRFFLENYSSVDEVWSWFRKRDLEGMSAVDAPPSRSDGLDANAMGIVASSLAWRFGKEVSPVVRSHATLHAG